MKHTNKYYLFIIKYTQDGYESGVEDIEEDADDSMAGDKPVNGVTEYQTDTKSTDTSTKEDEQTPKRGINDITAGRKSPRKKWKSTRECFKDNEVYLVDAMKSGNIGRWHAGW